VSTNPRRTRRGLWHRIGPAFVVGAVIIGPGSVTLMSATGAAYGYAMLWLSLLAGGLMAGHIALFMRFGLYCDDTFLGVAARKFGRWFAVLCGISLFCVGSAFQFGNNLGVTAGMDALVGGLPQVAWPPIFTALAIAFLFSFKNIYKVIEKVMTVFLVGMFCAFLVNLIRAKPDVAAAVHGACVPSIPAGANWVKLGGLVATTFVLPAAFFQSYLVRAKGWRQADLADAATDTILASITYTLIGTVIMMTAAAVVYPSDGTVSFETMAAALEGVFGRFATIVFASGFWAAAFSSFITNTLIAGTLLNDGFGMGGHVNSNATKGFATLSLLIGMAVAIVIIQLQPAVPEAGAVVAAAESASRVDVKVTAIAIGQASTLLAVPLGAVAMVAVLFDRRATRGIALPAWAKAFVLLGTAVLLGITAVMLSNVRASLEKLFGGS
jgi:Mn2+/Fe2+ NRAMP family transporter